MINLYIVQRISDTKMGRRKLNAILIAILLIFSAMLGGCLRRDQASGEESVEERRERMIHVQKINIDEKTLTLDYKVSNPFQYDIWVCEDVDIYGNYDVETRISPDMLRIKLCLNLESNIMLSSEVFAKYRFLSPGESHSGRIVLTLPVRNDSPVYVFSFGEDLTKYKQVVLPRATFEIGYIKSTYLTEYLKIVERAGPPVPSSGQIVGMPKLKQEKIDGKLHKFAIVPDSWQRRGEEKSVTVVVTDVEVPCLLEN